MITRLALALALLTLSACGPRLVLNPDGTFLDTATGEPCVFRGVRVGGEARGQVEPRCVGLAVPLATVYHGRADCRGPGVTLVSAPVVGELDGWGSWVLYGPGSGGTRVYAWNVDGVCDKAGAVPGAGLVQVAPLSAEDLDEVAPGA